MRLAAFADASVVVGGYGINHVAVDIIMLCQFKASADDGIDMVALVRGVEMVVTGEDLLLDVGYDVGIYHPPPPALTVVTIELTLTVVLCPPE